MHWLNRYRLWWLPTLLHIGIGAAIGFSFDMWLLGAAYSVGMLSHPLQGFVVNAFGHRFGGRNFDTPDHSRNNLIVAALVFGEGLQNNHHRYPASARFSTASPSSTWATCGAKGSRSCAACQSIARR